METIDFTEYVGKDTQTESAEIVETKYGLALRLSSKPLDEEGKVRASSMFSFQYDNENHKYFIGVDSKLDKFLTKKGLKADFIPDEIEKNMEIPVLANVQCKVQMNAKNGYLELL